MKIIFAIHVLLFSLTTHGSSLDDLRRETGEAYLKIAEKLSEARALGLTCELNAYQQDITDAVVKAQYILDEAFTREYSTYPLIEKVMGQNLHFKIRLEYWNEHESDSKARLEKLLENTKMFSLHSSVDGAAEILEFLPSQIVKSINRENIGADEQPIELITAGAWSLLKLEEGFQLEVIFKGVRTTYDIKVEEQSVLLTEKSSQFVYEFTSSPPDCEMD